MNKLQVLGKTYPWERPFSCPSCRGVRLEDRRIELVPENPGLVPVKVRPKDDLRIMGKVVGRKHK